MTFSFFFFGSARFAPRSHRAESRPLHLDQHAARLRRRYRLILDRGSLLPTATVRRFLRRPGQRQIGSKRMEGGGGAWIPGGGGGGGATSVGRATEEGGGGSGRREEEDDDWL